MPNHPHLIQVLFVTNFTGQFRLLNTDKLYHNTNITSFLLQIICIISFILFITFKVQVAV